MWGFGKAIYEGINRGRFVEDTNLGGCLPPRYAPPEDIFGQVKLIGWCEADCGVDLLGAVF
jgi:hypothetical protein